MTDYPRELTCYERVGMAWFNGLTPEQRAYWLELSGTYRPVDAYECYCQGLDRKAKETSHEAL